MPWGMSAERRRDNDTNVLSDGLMVSSNMVRTLQRRDDLHHYFNLATRRVCTKQRGRRRSIAGTMLGLSG